VLEIDRLAGRVTPKTECTEALDGLTFEQKRQITSDTAIALYGLG
jgi:hypothetical protein